MALIWLFTISLAFGVWSQSLSLRISKDILGPFSFFVCCCLCLFGMDVHFTNIICPWRSSQSHHELSIMDSLHFPNILMLTLMKKWRPIEPLEAPSIFKCNVNVNVNVKICARCAQDVRRIEKWQVEAPSSRRSCEEMAVDQNWWDSSFASLNFKVAAHVADDRPRNQQWGFCANWNLFIDISLLIHLVESPETLKVD